MLVGKRNLDCVGRRGDLFKRPWVQAFQMLVDGTCQSCDNLQIVHGVKRI